MQRTEYWLGCRHNPVVLRELTNVERIAVGHVRHGLSNSQIAAAMGLSPLAVRVMLVAICNELDLRSRAELIDWARLQD